MAQERSITSWATGKLDEKLQGLQLGDGVTTQSPLEGGFLSGEVSIVDRKGKFLPIYTLEVEIPWSGTIDGVECSGKARLPDICVEMLEDLEVEISSEGVSEESMSAALDADVIVTAVREWASEIRKAVAENAASLPRDPPTETRTPRAAALISDDEAMSAGGAAALDDADDVEEIPRQDEEEEPFTENEVEQMLEEVKQALRDAFPGEEGDQQVEELEEEMAKTSDLQEKGRMLMDVMDYLQNPPDDERDDRETGQGDSEEVDPPYPGEKGLKELWTEVTELCNEEDVDRLEDELKGKSGPERWAILLDVRDYLLNGDEEEQQAFANWKPTLSELEQEWKQMLKRVPPEEAKEVQEDWKEAGAEDKKRMVWDVRKFLQQQDAEAEEGSADQSSKGGKGKPPSKPPPSIDDPEIGRSEVRRRGARRGADYEYNYEYDVPGGKDDDNGEWDDYYSKEAKRAKRGRSPLVIIAGVMLLGGLTVVLTAAATAEEDESVTSSAMRLFRMR